MKVFVLKRALVVTAVLVAVIIGGFIVCELFPGQVVDSYWAARYWTRVALHVERLPQPRPAVPRPVFPYEDADGYAVMSAWIRTYFRAARGSLVIQQEAGASSPEPPAAIPASCFSSHIRSEFGEAFSDYHKQNTERWLLQPLIRQDHARYVFVPAGELVPGWGHGGPNPPGDTRRREYTVLSAVGFDADRSRAVLFVAQHYRLGGNYDFLLFRKDGVNWRLVNAPFCGPIVD